MWSNSQSPVSDPEEEKAETIISALPKRYFYIPQADSIICMLKAHNIFKSRSTFSTAVNMRIKQKI
jgi:hypothetical protein